MVKASTISTHDAKNTAPTRTTVPEETDVAMNTSLSFWAELDSNSANRMAVSYQTLAADSDIAEFRGHRPDLFTSTEFVFD
jgi:hypothetical protein